MNELKKSNLGDALLHAFMKANSEAAEQARKAMANRAIADEKENQGASKPKLKKSDLGQKLLEAMLNIDWRNPPKVKV